MADFVGQLVSSRIFAAGPTSQTLYPSGIASAEAFGTPVVAGPVTASGVASAEAFGTAVVTSNLTIEPAGVSSAEAFGGPTAAGPLIAGSVSSAEALGAPVVAGPITAAGVSSAEAFGTPAVTLQSALYPDGIASAEAFGTPQINVEIRPSSIASAEALGAPTVGFQIHPAGIATGEAFGTPQLNLELLAGPVASAEAFGAPVVAGPVIAASIGSAEAFGTSNVGFLLAPNSIAGAEAFGTPVVAFQIVPDSVPSAEAFGAPVVTSSITIEADSVLSAEALGSPVAAGPLIAGSVSSAEALGGPLVYIPGAATVSPSTVTAGTRFTIVSGQLDVLGCQDDFSDGIVGPLWNDISAGSGSVVEDGDRRLVLLDTGLAAGSTAGLSTVNSLIRDVDVRATFRLQEAARPRRAEVKVARLGLKVPGADTRVCLELILSDRGREIAFRVESGGDVLADTRVLSSAVGPADLRVLRAGRQVYLFLAGALLTSFEWLDAAVQIELVVYNDPVAAGTRVRTDLSRYARLPVLRFGDVPVRDLVMHDRMRAAGSTPTMPSDVDEASIYVTGCIGSASVLPGTMIVTRDGALIRFEGRPGQRLVITNDPRLTKV